MNPWTPALKLSSSREVLEGSTDSLCDAIRRGADLRVGTAFRHCEHIDTASTDDQLIQEQMDFRVVYLLEDRWTAGIENLRMPVSLPDGFGPRASMSFFMYNQDGHQAVARPYLDGGVGETGTHDPDMPKMHIGEAFDGGTAAPSTNFIYDFESYRFFVRDAWREVLAHDEQGQVVRGEVKELADLCEAGHEVKVAIRGLCDDLTPTGQTKIEHEVFVHIGPCYYCTGDQRLVGGANPVVRVRPSLPLGYASRAWDFGWLLPRTDGFLARWLCDPFTLKFAKSETRCAMRWFVNTR